MKRYFDTFHSLERFTRELDCHQHELQCQHCARNDQFVPHDVIYKQRSQSSREAVGKRIFCSNRYGRTGCGRTFRLYIASEIPSLRYGTAQLFVFLSALLAKLTVSAAYQQATGRSETRNAWRWLNKLDCRLINYRIFLKKHPEAPSSDKSKTRRFQILLPTIKRLFSLSNRCPCSHFQQATQSHFI